MRTSAPSAGRVLVAAGFALSCFALLLFLWVTFGGPVPLKPTGYRISAYFPEATALSKETDVRIGGVSVGKVKEVALAPPDRRLAGKDLSEAVIEIRPDFAPISSDARAIIRQKTLQGEAYVELAPGVATGDGEAADAMADAGALPPVSLGASANLSDAARESAEPIPEDGELGIGQVTEATQFDELLAAFDERSRAAAKRAVANGALALGGRALDLNDSLGNLGPFLDDAARIAELVRGQRGDLKRIIRDAGAVFDAASADDRALAGSISSANETFGGLADAHDELAESIALLPGFEREAAASLDRLDRLREKAAPVVRELVPVAADISPTLSSLRRLSPRLRGFFRRVDPLLSESATGLPALTDTVHELSPLMSELDPFLAELNPVVRFLDAYKERVATWFSNPNIGIASYLPEVPDQPAPRHSLRVLAYYSSESLMAHPSRLATNRGNGYFRPDGYLEGLTDLFIPSFDCKNPDYTETSHDTDEDVRLFDDGLDPEVGYDFGSCGLTLGFSDLGFGDGRFPIVARDP